MVENVPRSRLLMRLGEALTVIAYLAFLVVVGQTLPRERFFVAAAGGLAAVVLMLFIGWRIDDYDRTH